MHTSVFPFVVLDVSYSQCWCGFSPAGVTVVDDSECDFECSGNDDEQCGGYQRMSLYSFSDDTCDTFTEEGCFADSSDSRLLTEMIRRNTMSAEVCTTHHRRARYRQCPEDRSELAHPVQFIPPPPTYYEKCAPPATCSTILFKA